MPGLERGNPVNRRHGNTGPDIVRGAAEPALKSTLGDARQPRASLVLRWVPYAHALRYDVTLATPELRVLFHRSGVELAELAVPAPALEGLPSGARLVWRVEATLEDGRSVESPALTLELD